jgi:hypothetical protein
MLFEWWRASPSPRTRTRMQFFAAPCIHHGPRTTGEPEPTGANCCSGQLESVTCTCVPLLYAVHGVTARPSSPPSCGLSRLCPGARPDAEQSRGGLLAVLRQAGQQRAKGTPSTQHTTQHNTTQVQRRVHALKLSCCCQLRRVGQPVGKRSNTVPPTEQTTQACCHFRLPAEGRRE